MLIIPLSLWNLGERKCLKESPVFSSGHDESDVSCSAGPQSHSTEETRLLSCQVSNTINLGSSPSLHFLPHFKC